MSVQIAGVSHSRSRRHAINWSLMVLTTLALLSAAYASRAVIVPLAFALLLSLTLRPIVRFLKRRGIPHALGATIVLFVVISLLLLGATYLVDPAKEWIDDAPQDLRIVGERLSPVWSQWKEIQDTSEQLEDLGETMEADEPSAAMESTEPADVGNLGQAIKRRLDGASSIRNHGSGSQATASGFESDGPEFGGQLSGLHCRHAGLDVLSS